VLIVSCLFLLKAWLAVSVVPKQCLFMGQGCSGLFCTLRFCS